MTISQVEENIIEKLLPTCQQLRSQGLSDRDIKKFIQNHHQKTTYDFYQKNKISDLRKILFFLTGEFKKADSKIELKLYDLFTKYNIPFRFQYKITPYRADYLLWGYLIVELDGPQHELQKKYDEKRDRYLKKMGYVVLRIPTWVLIEEPERVVESVLEFKPKEKVKKSKSKRKGTYKKYRKENLIRRR